MGRTAMSSRTPASGRGSKRHSVVAGGSTRSPRTDSGNCRFERPLQPRQPAHELGQTLGGQVDRESGHGVQQSGRFRLEQSQETSVVLGVQPHPMPTVRGRAEQGGRFDLGVPKPKLEAEAAFDRFHLERGSHLAHRNGHCARRIREHARRAGQCGERSPDLARCLFAGRVIVPAVVARIHEPLECLPIGDIAQELLVALEHIELDSLAAPPGSALAQSLQDGMDRQAVLARQLPDQTLALVDRGGRGLAQSRIEVIEQARPTWHAQKRRQGLGQRIRGIAQGIQALLERRRTVRATRGFVAARALQTQNAAFPGSQVQEKHRLAFDVGRPPLGDGPFPIAQGERIGAHIDPSGQEGADGTRHGRGRQKLLLPSQEILEASQEGIVERSGTVGTFGLPLARDGHRLRRAVQVGLGHPYELGSQRGAEVPWGRETGRRDQHRLADGAGQSLDCESIERTSQLVEVHLVGEPIFYAVSLGPAVQRLGILWRCLDGGQAFAWPRRWQQVQRMGIGGRLELLTDVGNRVDSIVIVIIVIAGFDVIVFVVAGFDLTVDVAISLALRVRQA